ncbi:MAG: DEAD/DEAH box helicase [Candidatus Aminicenantes bacterium]|nr:DEAD/DEAH box helicase [Candidatus Aminicenantes bacterium]
MDDDKNIKVERALQELFKLKNDVETELRLIKIDASSGEFCPFPERLAPEVVAVYKKRGIERLFSHQAEALENVLQRRHTVVATPTASGKTLIYNAAALDALTRDPSAKSLYLFPTKALSQDQLAELFDLNKALGDKLGLYTYDGDTPQTMRQAIRKQAQIVLSNPYMLHSGILPHHTKWASLFENLKYVVIDELHYYTGVFGSHVANVMRRLKRICAFYGTRPVFIMSSATIANPAELAEKLIEEKVVLVDRNGAPRGEKFLVFFNPPVVNRSLGIRRSYVSMSREIAGILLKAGLQVITFANSRLITEILVKYLKNDFEKTVQEKGTVRGYRGGYLPRMRREIEKGLRDGKIKAVVSTNALELGIDIGSLDAVVLASYPGSISSTWQRIGRAGRRSSRSLGVLVASSMPIDQYIVNHPEYFSGQSPEMGRINADNLTVLMDHIKCAAFELPFAKGDEYGSENLEEILSYLTENQVLLRKDDKWFWTEEGYPADAVSLNRITSDNFVVVDRTEGERVIAEVGFSDALETLHPKAIYILEGEQYVVEELDYENRKAFLTRSNADYYTDSITYTKIKVLDIFDETRLKNHTISYGDVHVFSQVVGFKKLKFFTMENVGAGELQLPQQEMHTTAFWLTVRNDVLQSLDFSNEEKIEAVAGIAYLMKQISPVILLCDVRDVGVAIEDNLSKDPLQPGTLKNMLRNQAPSSGTFRADMTFANRFEPNIFIFDKYPGGVGFSETLYDKGKALLEKALEIIESCPCPSGCPSCVSPAIRAQGNHKSAARFILKLLLDRLDN